jgi:TolB-like protein
MIVTSFADIDDVRFSSTFGRMIGEQIGSRLSQSGYRVIEPKMRGNIFIPHPDRGASGGEFMLSRELVNLSFEQDAQAVIVGTYAAAKDLVYVTMKVIDVKDNSIVYSMDYAIPLDDNTKKLLRDEKRRKG